MVRFQTADFSKLEANDSLAITGHGLPGKIGGLNAATMADRYLLDGLTGFKRTIKQLMLVNCYSGTEVSPGEPDTSAVGILAKKLEPLQIAVRGAVGPLLASKAISPEGPWEEGWVVSDTSKKVKFAGKARYAADIAVLLINGLFGGTERIRKAAKEGHFAITTAETIHAMIGSVPLLAAAALQNPRSGVLRLINEEAAKGKSKLSEVWPGIWEEVDRRFAKDVTDDVGPVLEVVKELRNMGSLVVEHPVIEAPRKGTAQV